MLRLPCHLKGIKELLHGGAVCPSDLLGRDALHMTYAVRDQRDPFVDILKGIVNDLPVLINNLFEADKLLNGFLSEDALQ